MIEQFVAEKLDKRDYPKIKEHQKKIKNELEKKFYREEFSVEKFIKRIPDPLKYFLDEKRVSYMPTEWAIVYTKNRYQRHSLKTIKHYVRKYKNFALACAKISRIKPDRTSKRPLEEILTLKDASVELLQEISFIEHYDEIVDYILSEKERRRIAYNEAQIKGELVTCGCCYSEVLFEESTVCEDGDLFCTNCVKKGAEIRIGEGHTTFPCLKDCSAHFSLAVLQSVLNPSVFSKLNKRKQVMEVQAAGISGLEMCPFCEFATIPPPENKIFTCLSPECGKESCRLCHKESHIPLRCNEVEKDEEVEMRTYIENKMTEALVRTCWKCKAQFIKENGCNKMECACGAKMCYICRKRVTSYSHFFGPGGTTDTKKCPLYSSDKVLHVDLVKVVGEEAKKKLGINSDTKLKHDPTKTGNINKRIEHTALPNGLIENVPKLQEEILGTVFGNKS